MSVKLKIERGKYLFLRISQSGIRKTESLSLRLTGDPKADKEILRVAEEVRLLREIQIFRGEYNLIDHTGSKKTLYSYIAELVNAKGRKTSLFKVLRYLEHYPDGQTIQIKSINASWIESFQNYLLKESGLSNNSISQYITAIKSTLNKAVIDKFILQNPSHYIKTVKVPDKAYDILTIDEIQKLITTPLGNESQNEVKKAFIFACFAGGLRVSDLISLKWENIEIRDNKIYLLKVIKKTKKTARFELNKTAYEIIQDGKLHNRNDLIFPLISKTNTYKYLKEWAIAAGIDKNMGWHTARRSNATLLLESGVNIVTIQNILGHNKLSTTQKYIQVSDKAINDAASALPEIKIDKEKMG